MQPSETSSKEQLAIEANKYASAPSERETDLAGSWRLERETRSVQYGRRRIKRRDRDFVAAAAMARITMQGGHDRREDKKLCVRTATDSYI
jgi:hypothetical protein